MSSKRNLTGAQRWGRALGPVVGLLCLAVPNQSQAYDWLQFNGDAAHSGNNVLEKTLGAFNVATLAQKFQVTLPAVADGAPVFARGVVTASGKKDLLFLLTKAGHILALDATTGGTVWSHQYGANGCLINNGGVQSCFTTSSPAIDPTRQYVYAYGLDGFVHKYQVGDGVEIMTGGWPQLATLKPYDEKASSALALATSQGVNYLYVAQSGYPTDAGGYQGHVTTINLATGAQKVFNVMCSNMTIHFAPADPNCPNTRQGAVWARPGVVYSAALDRVLFTSANSSFPGFTGNAGGFNWNESVIAIHPDGTGAAGKPLDTYTPANYQTLDNNDKDLGSTGPALLPVPPNSAIQHLAVQAGKDSFARLINLDNMSGAGGPGGVGGEIGAPVLVPMNSLVASQAAVWSNPLDGSTWFYYGTNRVSGSTLAFDGSNMPSISLQWTLLNGGTSPLIANNVLYVGSTGSVRALDPTTGGLLWQGSIGNVHWESVVVHNGMVYMSDEAAHLTAFAPTAARAVAGVDLNLNRRSDLLWDNATTGQTAAWLMNGVAATQSSFLFTQPNWTLANTGDFDGDGRSDLVWRNAVSGQSAMWLMSGTTATASVILPASSSMNVVAVADLDGDGRSDLVWRDTSNGNTVVWLMSGTTMRSSKVISTDPNWQVTHTGDFNGDGKADLVLRNTVSGQTAIWLMSGTTTLATTTVNSDPNLSVVAVADLDGDGRSDLVWRNSATGETSAWLMNGATATATAVLFSDPAWSVTHVADLDGDGKADLVWRNASTGATAAWLMRGLVSSATALLFTDPNWTVVHVGDFDGDGRADLAWVNAVDGRTALWLMNGLTATQAAVIFTDPNWMPVDLH